MVLEFLPSQLVFPPHCVFGFLCRKACFVRGTNFPAKGAQTHCEEGEVYCSSWRIDPTLSTVRVPMALLKVLATLNLARQMTTAVMKPLVVPRAPPRPGARDKDTVGHRVVNERRLPKPPKSQHWVWKRFMVYAKEALANIAVCRIRKANRDVDKAKFY